MPKRHKQPHQRKSEKCVIANLPKQPVNPPVLASPPTVAPPANVTTNELFIPSNRKSVLEHVLAMKGKNAHETKTVKLFCVQNQQHVEIDYNILKMMPFFEDITEDVISWWLQGRDALPYHVHGVDGDILLELVEWVKLNEKNLRMPFIETSQLITEFNIPEPDYKFVDKIDLDRFAMIKDAAELVQLDYLHFVARMIMDEVTGARLCRQNDPAAAENKQETS